MSMVDTDAGCYCTKAVYMDEIYTCLITGEPCNITPIPNQFECTKYSKHILKERKQQNGTV